MSFQSSLKSAWLVAAAGAPVRVGFGGGVSREFNRLVQGTRNKATAAFDVTAVEQLLLSSAVDLAMAKFFMPELADKKVYVDFTNLKCYDVEYVKVAVRARIAQQGATLVGASDQADCVAEVASGALATEHKTGVVGIPHLPMPQSDVPLPEVPFFIRA